MILRDGGPRPAHARRRARLQKLGRLVSGVWFLENELALLPDLVPAGAVCVDVGANRGVYMAALALLAGPDGRVLAVEPQHGPLRSARALTRGLRLDNVTLCQVGVGDVEGRLSLVVPYRYGMPVYGRSFLADAPELGSGDFADFTSARRVEITVTTLDTLVRDHGLARVDFVKCDIEGAELRMLRGGQKTIEDHRPTLLLEIEDRHVTKYGHEAHDVVGWLAERGYRPHVKAGRTLSEVDGVGPQARNYVFLPS